MNAFLNRFNTVKQIPIFAKLNWYDLQRIARKSTLEEFKKGEVICRQGTPPDFFYCLVSGRLRTYTTNDKGRMDNVEFIHRGVHFGIISLLTGENHTLTYEAVNNSTVLKIEKTQFHQILTSIPALSIELNQSLSKRVRSAISGVKTIFESTIISVYSPVRSAGSSTYAVNLAMSLKQETNKKVVFVNLVPGPYTEPSTPEQQTMPRWKKSPAAMGPLLSDSMRIVQAITRDESGIDLIHLSFDPNGPALKSDVGHLLSALVGDYHYVVIDLPNAMDDAVLETLTQSDLVHLITSDREKDLQLTRNVIDQLERALKASFREEKIKVIIRAFHAQIYLSFEEINKFIDFYIYNSLPLIMPEDLTHTVDTPSMHFQHCHEQALYAKTVRRIAREIGGVLVGLVLGGGAALGVAHIGVIRVLEEAGVPIDIVVGSSMGALVGGFWASGMTVEELEGAAREFEKPVDTLTKLYSLPNPLRGLVGSRRVKAWLKKHVGNKTFYSVRIPFKAVAFDLVRRQDVIIESGSLVDGIRRSISIPGVFSPLSENGMEIIDGGVLNPLPTDVMVGLGIKRIIAVNVLQSPEDVMAGVEYFQRQLDARAVVTFIQNPFHFVGFRIGRFFHWMFNPIIPDIIIRTLQASEYVIAEQSAQQADVVIHPELVGVNWHELDKVDQLLEAGVEAARQKLPEIKRMLEED